MENLVAVRYRIFEGEQPAVVAALSGGDHEIAGEVVLSLEGGREMFVSWSSKPVQYSVCLAEASFFVADAGLRDYDVTRSPIWAHLLGEPVLAEFQDREHQVLCFRCGQEAVYACAFERGGWYADAITIRQQVPQRCA